MSIISSIIDWTSDPLIVILLFAGGDGDGGISMDRRYKYSVEQIKKILEEFKEVDGGVYIWISETLWQEF